MSHVLFLYSFVALRLHRPNAPRPFRLPGGTGVACICCAPPLAMCICAFVANLRSLAHASAFACVVLVGGLGHLGGLVFYNRGRAAARVGDAKPIPR